MNFFQIISRLSSIGRPGTFIEIPLDVQASNKKISDYKDLKLKIEKDISNLKDFRNHKRLKVAKRPIILLGGGVQGNQIIDLQKIFQKLASQFKQLGMA